MLKPMEEKFVSKVEAFSKMVDDTLKASLLGGLFTTFLVFKLNQG
jgi:hypothetical protein